MQLGFVSTILPELSLPELLTFSKKAGAKCVEVMCWPVGKAERRYAGVTHVDVTDMTQSRADDILATVHQSGVALSGLGYYPNALSPDHEDAERGIAHLKKTIQAAPLLKVGVVTSFVGKDWTRPMSDNWTLFGKIWPDIIRLAEDNGVKIAIENCPMYFTKDEWPGGKNLATSPAYWRRMFEIIPSPNFGLNFDPSHFVWQRMDYLTPLREFKDRLFHIHCKDARLDVDKLNDLGIFAHPNEYHTPKLPGLGDVDWGKFFSVLSDIGYRGPVCAEVEDRAYEGSLELRKISVVQSLRYLRNFAMDQGEAV